MKSLPMTTFTAPLAHVGGVHERRSPGDVLGDPARQAIAVGAEVHGRAAHGVGVVGVDPLDVEPDGLEGAGSVPCLAVDAGAVQHRDVDRARADGVEGQAPEDVQVGLGLAHVGQLAAVAPPT